MLRKVVAAAAASFALVSFAVPASAARTQALYLAQTSDDCSAGVSFEILTSPSDNHPCTIVPRVLNEGEGITNTNEAFRTTRKLALKLDTSRRIQGTFYLSGSFLIGAPVDQAEAINQGAGKVAADLAIKVNTTRIGTVRVAGDVTPGTPASQAFSFSIPKSLKNVTITKVAVDVTWVTCLSGGCHVGVNGNEASTMTLPTR